MADLNVQPKQKKSILPWLLLALGIIALLFFLLRGCNNNKGAEGTTDSTTSATVPATDAGAKSTAFGNVDFNAPAVAYDEITDKNINVRGNNNFGIYGLGENVVFDEGKNTIRPDAEQNLKQIAASIGKRYKEASVRVYGYTDSIGSAGYNKELAEQRAEAVQNWLVKNGSITQDKISLEPVGEARPVATNETEAGRKQNRRVEIVAKSGE